ncbi:MAG TPA: hypothetical protein VMV32_08450 [Ignavibacteriaceae bacterium]|nr:hypothetical protein [Ignavibacteriaceae bacterium]
MATFKVSQDGDTGILHSTYLDNKFIDENYRKLLEGLVEEDEYFYSVYTLGEWSALKLSGRIYKRFSDHNILSGDNKYIHSLKQNINVCCDFNYDPMKWALVQELNGIDYVFDEIIQEDTETEAMAKELLSRYPNAKGYDIYGDYSGDARSTRRRSTDYDIIREVLNIKRDDIYITPNPVVTTRTNIVNWRLCNKKGDRKLLVNDNCEHAIKDFRKVKWYKGRKIEDQTDPEHQLSHISSAIGYYINYKYTLKDKPKALWRY